MTESLVIIGTAFNVISFSGRGASEQTPLEMPPETEAEVDDEVGRDLFRPPGNNAAGCPSSGDAFH